MENRKDTPTVERSSDVPNIQEGKHVHLRQLQRNSIGLRHVFDSVRNDDNKENMEGIVDIKLDSEKNVDQIYTLREI